MNRIMASIKLSSLLILVFLFNGCALLERNTAADADNFYTLNNYDTSTYHVVQRGETLSSIAQRYGRHYKDVAQWNHISPPYTIYPGQRLLVSGPADWQTYSNQVNSVPVDLPSRVKSQPLKQSAQINYSRQKTTTQSGIHQVRQGETLYRIAQRYGLDFRDLAAWNQIPPPYQLAVGQKLRLTLPAKPQKQFLAVGTSPEYYTVQAGDTFYSIAQRFGYSVADIKAWNNLHSNELTVGQQLSLKPPKSLLANPSQSHDTFYTVRRGDTLYSIAKRYQLQVAELKRWNQLSSNELSVGMVLQLTPQTTRSNTQYAVSTACHTVQKGETLYRIAQRYGYPIADIAQWNHLQWPYTLNVGQTLKASPTASHCS